MSCRGLGRFSNRTMPNPFAQTRDALTDERTLIVSLSSSRLLHESCQVFVVVLVDVIFSNISTHQYTSVQLIRLLDLLESFESLEF